MSDLKPEFAADREMALRHLWMCFTPIGTFGEEHELPMIVRGDGCYVWDDRGRIYLDATSGLFCHNIGHGRGDIAQAGADQAATLAFFPIWSGAHPVAARLAARLAALAPGDLDRVFLTSSGSEANEAALKLARQYHKLTGHPNKTKVIARRLAYHGVTAGALSMTGITYMRAPFEPMAPGASHVPATDLYRAPGGAERLAESVREQIEFEGPETVAAVIMEPVQSSGGCLVPPPGYFRRVREICDAFDVLLISDEIVCAWGRLGEWFGCQLFDYLPDILTTAKGLTSSYAPLGAMIAREHLMTPFLEGDNAFLHGSTFAGHPGSCAVALANIDALADEGVIENVRAETPALRAALESLRDIPIVGDVRGEGFFWAIELVRDRGLKLPFPPGPERKRLKGLINAGALERGVIVRADDRGELVVQVAPPLIAGAEQFADIAAALRPVLEEVAALVAADPVFEVTR